ncbi:unnamed protein product, partial [Prorocentrum cordatum]
MSPAMVAAAAQKIGWPLAHAAGGVDAPCPRQVAILTCFWTDQGAGPLPQVRLAKLRDAGVTEKACQLCGVTPGTLLHRRVCEASLPLDGWPEPLEVCGRLLSTMSDARLALLRTRGLLTLRLPRPLPQEEVAVRWFTDPPD